MALHNVTLDNLAGADTTVVGTLGGGEALQTQLANCTGPQTERGQVH